MPESRGTSAARVIHHARKPDDYDNELEGWSTSDADPKVAEIVEWLDALMDWGVHALWVKDTHPSGQRYGGYYHSARCVKLIRDALSHSGKATGVHFSINPVRPELLMKADHELKAGVGVPKNSDVICRRILPIDIDPVRPSDISATEKEKRRAWEKMKAVRVYLRQHDWPEPMVVDSGNGFYLLYRIDLPTEDGDLVRRVLEALRMRFKDENVDIDTSVANAGRVLKIPGTMACKGISTEKRPHRLSRVVSMPQGDFKVVDRDRLEEIAAKRSRPQTAPDGHSEEKLATPAVVEAARRYLAKMPAAISGSRGHDATLLAATRLVVGFNLSSTSRVALRLIKEFNERCLPKWSDRELQRKLHEADRLANEKGELRGGLLSGKQERNPSHYEPLPGRDFPIAIPDFEFIAGDDARLPIEVLEKTTPLYGFAVLMSWHLQRRSPRCPDVVLRDILWGARPPKAWRRALRKICEKYRLQIKCPKHCPLYRTRIRHQHLFRESSPKSIIYELTTFAEKTGGGWKRNSLSSIPDDAEVDDAQRVQSPAARWRRRWDEERKIGAVYLGYYPIFVFGRSKRVGLSVSQVRLMVGVTRELTRVGMRAGVDTASNGKPHFVRAETSRRDKAEIVNNAEVRPSGNATHKVVCPLLDKSASYVVFGGNLHSHRGCGYRLLHSDHNCWLGIAGYRTSDFLDSPQSALRSLFGDLHRLAKEFDLIVAGRHAKSDTWKSLDEMTDCLKTGCGQDWLSECTMRIYAPADYLIRWRYTLSKKLGFSWIPGGEAAPFVSSSPSSFGRVESADSLRRWIGKREWTTARLAKELECRRETVSRHLSGRRNSAAFWSAINALASRQGAEPPP